MNVTFSVIGRALAKKYKAIKVDPTSVELTESDMKKIEGVKNKIAVIIDEFKAKGKTSFVRLSSRR